MFLFDTSLRLVLILEGCGLNMSEVNQIPFMLQLLDDPSEIVRENLALGFCEYGDGLWQQLQRLVPPPSQAQLQKIWPLVCASGLTFPIVLFPEGTLVRHVYYGYRGVVVGVDEECCAEESWYQANRSQPRKDQPWFHVLVDGTIQSTYAAQNSLVIDTEGSEVKHPLVNNFFLGFSGGRYQRNATPWVV